MPYSAIRECFITSSAAREIRHTVNRSMKFVCASFIYSDKPFVISRRKLAGPYKLRTGHDQRQHICAYRFRLLVSSARIAPLFQVMDLTRAPVPIMCAIIDLLVKPPNLKKGLYPAGGWKNPDQLLKFKKDLDTRGLQLEMRP